MVADVRGHEVSEAASPVVFLPHGQHPDVFLPSLIVRTSLPPEAVAAAIRDRINAYDPKLLVQRIRPMDEVVSRRAVASPLQPAAGWQLRSPRLVLAAVGIYGVVVVPGDAAHARDRHPHGARREDGERHAAGAGRGDVAGAVGAPRRALPRRSPATRAIRTLLFGVTPLDPVSLLLAPASWRRSP